MIRAPRLGYMMLTTGLRTCTRQERILIRSSRAKLSDLMFKSHEFRIHGAYRCGAVLDFHQLPDIENVI